MYPNGEVTIGLIPYKKPVKSQSEKRFDRDYYAHQEFCQIRETAEKSARDMALSQAEKTKAFARLDGKAHEDVYRDRSQNQQSKRSKKGLNGISSYGGRMVRNGCHILQKSYGKHRLGFVTPTLPEHPIYTPIWIHDWATIVKDFIQEVKRELERKDAVNHVVAVTEIHPKRSKRIGYAVPHLHFVFVAWDGQSRDKEGRKQYYINADKMREMFGRVLRNRIAHYLENDVPLEPINPRVSVDRVKKSAEGYLGKYLSKGKKDVQQYIEDGNSSNMTISHWWHCTRELRSAVKGLVKTLPVDILTAVLQKINLKMRGIVHYIRPINKMIGDTEKLIGYVLKLTPPYFSIAKKELLDALDTA